MVKRSRRIRNNRKKSRKLRRKRRIIFGGTFQSEIISKTIESERIDPSYLYNIIYGNGRGNDDHQLLYALRTNYTFSVYKNNQVTTGYFVDIEPGYKISYKKI